MTENYYIGIRGNTKRLNVKGTGHSDLFDSFHGIGDAEFRDSPLGYARAYTASSMMFRCVNVIANTFASLELVFYDQDNNPLDPQHKAYQVLGRDKSRLWRTTAKDMQIFGKAYWLLEPNGVYRINPLYVSVDKLGNELRGFFWNNGRGNRYIEPQNMGYFFDYDPEDDLEGISPAQVALTNIGAEIGIETFIKNYFLNDATPAGILTSDQNIPEAEAERLKRWWERWFRGVQRAFRTAVLGRGLNYQQITPLLKDLVTTEISEDTARKICQAFGVPLTMALATEAANYSTSDESRKSFYTETVLPFADVLLPEVNRQVVPYIDEDIHLDVDRSKIEVLQEDRVEITTRSTTSFAGGIRGLNEARRLEGEPDLEIAGGDLFLINGNLITTEQLKTGELPGAQANSVMALGHHSFPSEPLQLRDVILSRKNIKKNNNTYIIYGLGSASVLQTMQSRLVSFFPDITLQDPLTLHITSLCTLDAPASVLGEMICDPETFPVTIEDYGYFQTPSGWVIFADVRRDGGIWQRQQQYRQAAEAQGYQLPASMSPAMYHPHITLGVLPYKPNKLPVLGHKPILYPSTVYVSEDTDTGYEISHVWQLGYPDVLKELGQWQTKAIKRHAQVRFETHAMPKSFAGFLRMDLGACEPDEVKTVFRAYRDLFTAKQLDLKPDDFPTPEEIDRYWNGLEDLHNELVIAVQDALDRIPLQIAQNLRNGVEAMDDAIIFQGVEEDLLGRLSGDDGALTKIFLAGAARGNDLLEPSIKASLTTSWEILIQEALAYAREQAAERIRGITDTTKEIFRTKIAEWVQQGGSLYKLADWIEGKLPDLEIPEGWTEGRIRWATSPARALIVSQSESTTLFNRGVEQRWKQAGVQETRWRTANDSRVCNLCRSLNNQVGNIEQGVMHQNKYYKPPAHPGCRCTQAPISKISDRIQLAATPKPLQEFSPDHTAHPPTIL